MIAGALILAFFFSVAYKQKAISEERLELTLVSDVENILTGAVAGKGIAQSLPIPPQGIEFKCDEGCFCRMSIGGKYREFGGKPIFAPMFLEDRELFVWSMEWKQPYRVANFLFITNPNIKYYFVYDTADSWSKARLQQLTKMIPPPITERKETITEFNYENITSTELTSLKAGEDEHTKFIFLNVEPATLDDSFRRKSASAIKIDQRGVGFYEKDRTNFRMTKYLSYSGISTLYAAIFSEDHTMYECGLKTAFRKLSQTSQIYAERAAVLQEKAFAAGKAWCDYGAPSATRVCEQAPDPATVVGALCEQHRTGKQLMTQLNDPLVGNLNQIMQQLDSSNRNFLQQGCPELF